MSNQIVTPRGLVHFDGALPKLISAVLLVAGMVAWLNHETLNLFRGWSLFFDTFSGWTGMPASVVMSRNPELLANIGLPPGMDIGQGLMGALAAGGLMLAASFAIPPANVPARYALRAVAFFVVVPALVSLVTGISFKTDAATHVADVFRAGYWFMLVAPVVFGLAGFILPGNLARRATLVVLALAYFYLTIPLLALFHLHVLALLGFAWAPLLNIVGKIFLFSFILIAFYGLIASAE